jgi:hypothetical protein
MCRNEGFGMAMIVRGSQTGGLCLNRKSFGFVNDSRKRDRKAMKILAQAQIRDLGRSRKCVYVL